MQFIRDIYIVKQAAKRPVISFEFFPPKTEEGDRALLQRTIPALLQLKPDFCSVTYGAGGSTRDKTLMIADQIQREYKFPVMVHLTCVQATEDEIGKVLAQSKSLGIKNILALRGDPPAGSTAFAKTAGGFEYSYQLVEFIRKNGEFSIGAAGFPEGHIACKEGKYVDWDRLKAKIDCGVDFVITQLFFDTEDFLFFRDHMIKKLGVTTPICPGVLPIMGTNQIKRFTSLCGAKLPQTLLSCLEQYGEDEEKVTAYGIEFASKQCEHLLKEGVPGLHFYTLNKAHSVTQIMKNLALG